MTQQEKAPEVLFVGGAGQAPLSIDVVSTALAQARSRGMLTRLLSHAADIPHTRRAVDLADGVDALDFTDADAAVDWSAGLAAADPRPRVVFTGREPALGPAARMARALGVAGNPPWSVDTVRNKDACRTFLARAGFRQPAVRLCHDRQEAEQAMRETRGPWVVKPRVGGGSLGVSLVAQPAELPAALDLLPDEGAFLVEEFVQGEEYSVEGLFLGGSPHVLAVTAKRKLPPPYFVEVGHALPAPLPEQVTREVTETVVKALTALELRFGLFHVELWLTADGIVLGEVHARLAGGYIHRMLAHAVPGLEMFGAVFDDALGRPPAAADLACTRAGASRFFTPPPGRLVAVEGWEAASTHPAVVAAELRIAPGDVIPSYRHSEERVGALAVGADTVGEAEELVGRLVESVRFVVEPAPGAGS
ncbi:ATP-grasp domain-containing protein [Streptomyces sp. NPDC091268]|uniref:ATP-grasp domain-containing protein n=1 Tax=Streptomyces sp. NPDC091268 TaxID=3365979 RepID=UPI00382BB1B0